MNPVLDSRHTPVASYSPLTPAIREAILAEAIGCILGGRPYPEQLRATVYMPPRPATVEAGCAWALAGPG
jgi:hypothetical protein